jgi:hypothetical protein
VVPFLAYVHEPAPDSPEDRPWEPNWRVWRPGAAGVAGLVGAGEVHGAVGLALVLTGCALVLRALDAALPYRGGLREWRQ